MSEEIGTPTPNGMLNNLISFMEQLAASGMEHKDIVGYGYAYAFALYLSKSEMETPQGQEISATRRVQDMDFAADLLKAAVGRGIERSSE